MPAPPRRLDSLSCTSLVARCGHVPCRSRARVRRLSTASLRRSLSGRPARRLRQGLAILLLIWASYAVAATALVQLGGVQKMLGAGDVQIGFRRAWSFWPGHVHAEDLRLV